MQVFPDSTCHDAANRAGGDSEFHTNAGKTIAGSVTTPNLHNICGCQDRPGIVPLLFTASGPTTVPRLITTVVVDAIDRSVGRPLAHVGEEPWERHPLFADSDSSSSVTTKGRRIGIKTPLFHRFPTNVRRTKLVKGCVTVLSVGLPCVRLASATGASGNASVISLRSATATATPPRRLVATPVLRPRDNGPVSERSSSNINSKSSTWHTAINNHHHLRVQWVS